MYPEYVLGRFHINDILRSSAVLLKMPRNEQRREKNVGFCRISLVEALINPDGDKIC